MSHKVIWVTSFIYKPSDAFVVLPCEKYLPGGHVVRVEAGIAVETIEESEQDEEAKKGRGYGQD